MKQLRFFLSRPASYWVGRLGEFLVRLRLSFTGYRIVAVNWHTLGGELDLVATRMGTLFIVEVKTHRFVQVRRPCDALTWTKRQRIVRATRAYIGLMRPNYRRLEFVLAEVILSPIPRVRIIRDAFRVNEVR